MPAPPNHVFSAFAFISFFLCLIRFPLQWHTWNIGIHLFLGWVGLSCLSLGINSIVWNKNVGNWAPVWCDITSRLIVGTNVALPAVILTISRRLYFLASPTSLLHSEEQRRREMMIDLGIGIGLPIIAIIFSFFAQDYRFMIAEDYGCNIAVLNSWVTLVVFTLPPILLEIVAGVYGCLSVYSFYKLGHRSQLQCFSRYQNLNANRYVRLMCFSLCDLFVGLPLATTFLYFELSPPGLVHYPGLKQAHAHISEILPVPAFAWRATMTSELSFELHRWSIVWSGFVFFAIFGLTGESRNTYRAALRSVVQFVFIRKPTMKRLPNSPPASSKAEEFTFKSASGDPVNVNVNVLYTASVDSSLKSMV